MVFPPEAPPATQPAVTDPPTTPPTEPPATEPPVESEQSIGLELVAVTIDEIGVTAVAPLGWDTALDGTYAGTDAALEFGAELNENVPDLEELGFVPVGRHVAGDLTWNLHALDTGEVFVGVALTEIGAVTYGVAIEVPSERADEYFESVVVPALEAFEAGELPEPTVPTLAGGPPEEANLRADLETLVAETGLPAVGVAVFDSDDMLESAVAGVRRSGDPTPVDVDDSFSIGSNVKAMTATLVGTFVDDGVVTWDTTVAEVFGDSLGALDESMAAVTVRQLLTHTSGLSDDDAVFVDAILGESEDGRPLMEQRIALAERAVGRPPRLPAGEHAYSNIGYTTVGAVLERLTGVPYEELLQTRIFDALGMDSCGFYAPGTPGRVDQPWGHLVEESIRPVDPGHTEAELGHAIAPAGTVHCSMTDWARFLQSQLRGFRGSDTEIVSADVFDALRTVAPDTDYALGGVFPQPDGSELIWHNGSNQRFTSETWLLPEEGRGLLIVTNVGVGLALAPMQQLAESIFTRNADEGARTS